MRRWIMVGMAVAAMCGAPVYADDAPDLRNGAWSLNLTPERLVVSVSPARQTLQIAGSTGTVLGAGVSSVVNDRYRKDLNDALGSYDPMTVLQSKMQSGLGDAVGAKLTRVAPMGTAARYNSVEEAEAVRLDRLNKEGFEAVLDLKAMGGIFTEDALIVAKVWGEAHRTESKKRVWRDEVFFTSEPALLSNKPGDPTDRMMARITSPKLGTEKDRLERWLEDGGALFKEEYERALDMTIAALAQSAGLDESPEGFLVLARTALENKDEEDALELYDASIRAGNRSAEVLNGRVVALARMKKRADDAQSAAKALTDEYPDYGPGWLNRAWVLAMVQDDLDAARPVYDQALTLGMAPVKKLDKKLKRD